MAVVVSFVTFFGREACYNGLTFEAISVPADLEKQGYSGTAVAQLVADEMDQMFNTKPFKNDYTFRRQMSALTRQVKSISFVIKGDRPEIQIPVAGSGIHDLVFYLRDFLGRGQGKITGSIQIEGNEALMHLRLTESNMPIPVLRADRTRLRDLFHQAAVALLERLDPNALANYYLVTDPANLVPLAEELAIPISMRTPLLNLT